MITKTSCKYSNTGEFYGEKLIAYVEKDSQGIERIKDIKKASKCDECKHKKVVRL